MKQIRVQGPLDNQFYYKNIQEDCYYTVFYLNGEQIICYKTEEVPDTKQLWNLEMAAQYPNETLFS
jgi:hypothetical protein